MRRARSTTTGRTLPLLGAVVGLLLLTVPAGSGGPVPAAATFASLDTGAVHVTLPSPLPLVNLSQDGNASIGASLQLAKIVELSGATGGGTEPTVVAAAFAAHARAFNASAAGGTGFLAGLEANLTVFHDSGLLFPLAGSDSPLHPLTPIAPTTLTVVVRSTGSPDVVSLAVTVANWPWVSASDLLAVGWEFGVTHDLGFAGCAGPRVATVSVSPCGASAFAYGNSTWGWDGFEGMQGLTENGPVAQLQWGSNVSLSDGGSAPVIAGAQRTGPSEVEVVYGAAPGRASAMTFALSYALVGPTVPPLRLFGAWLPYLAGAGLAGAVALGGLVAARRRDRALLDGL